jgi:hypothetical protein
MRARIEAGQKKAMADPEVRSRRSATLRKKLADPAARARLSDSSKKAWSDPDKRARIEAGQKKAMADPEVRSRVSEASKKSWSDPNVRSIRTAAIRRSSADPDVRARRSATLKKTLAKPEHRALKSIRMTNVWRDLKARAAAASAPADPKREPRRRLPKIPTARRSFQIWKAVTEELPRAERGIARLRELKKQSPGSSQHWQRALSKEGYGDTEIAALLGSDTAIGAAQRFVAAVLRDRKHPNGLALSTVQSHYSRCAKARPTEKGYS